MFKIPFASWQQRKLLKHHEHLIARALKAKAQSQAHRDANQHAIRTNQPTIEEIEIQLQQAQLTLASRRAQRDLLRFEEKLAERKLRTMHRLERADRAVKSLHDRWHQLKLAYANTTSESRARIRARVAEVHRGPKWLRVLRVVQIKAAGYAVLGVSYLFSGVSMLGEALIQSLGWAGGRVFGIFGRTLRVVNDAFQWLVGTISWIVQETVSLAFFLVGCAIEGVTVLLLLLVAGIVGVVMFPKELGQLIAKKVARPSPQDPPLTAPAVA